MNEKLVRYLHGFENKYPHQLEAQYARVVDKIVELWGRPEIETYFSELLIADRIDRQGFPPEVAREIFDLSRAYDEIIKKAQDDEQDVWSLERTVAKEELATYGLKFNNSSLFASVESGNTGLALLFLRAGMSVDTRDVREWTPLMVAAFNGNEEMAQLLIKHGADIMAQDLGGYTPLHWASFNGYTEVVRLLIGKGADINGKSNYGLTPLLQAAARGYPAIVEQLLEAGADANIATHDGGTPLHKAVANGHKEVVMRLLDAGASLLARHKNGTTPFSIAQKGKYPEILKLLRAAISAGAA